ncbi:MAG: glycosyltransferase family 2 protein [Gemmatimonadaceae bacterium]
MPEIVASIAICTRNRGPIFARALESLCVLEDPGVAWEVVLVDNASTDDTPQVIERFRSRLPIRAFVERTPGLSAARNRAVDEARGAYILWIDDDALVSPAWLTTYIKAFRSWPDASLLGGPIAVAFDGPLPEWFSRALPRIAGIYAYRDLGPDPIVLPALEHMLPFGTNYVTRTADQRRFRYDQSLGRHPDFPTRGSEETDLMLSMLESGLIGRWVPGAAVTHLKSITQATEAFIGSHIKDYGRFRAVRYPVPEGLRVGGAPLAAWRRLIRATRRYYWRRAFKPPEEWIDDFVEMHEASGAIDGMRERGSR